MVRIYRFWTRRRLKELWVGYYTTSIGCFNEWLQQQDFVLMLDFHHFFHKKLSSTFIHLGRPTIHHSIDLDRIAR